jgi:hypothetical protein
LAALSTGAAVTRTTRRPSRTPPRPAREARGATRISNRAPAAVVVTVSGVDGWLEEYRKLWEQRLDRPENYLRTLQAETPDDDLLLPFVEAAEDLFDLGLAHADSDLVIIFRRQT